MEELSLDERYEQLKNSYNIDNAGGGLSSYDRGITPIENFGFIEQQQKLENQSKFIVNMGKSIANGAINTGRGLVTAGISARDNYGGLYMKAHPEYFGDGGDNNEAAKKPNGDLEQFRDKYLTPFEVKPENAAENIAYAFGEGIGQLIPLMAASVIPVPGLTGAVLFGSIYGNDYEKYRDNGVDPRRAAKYSAYDAAIQGVLEKVGFDKMFGKLPEKGAALAFIKRALISEGTTEAIQTPVTQFADIFAMTDAKDWRDAGRIWDKNAEDNLKEIALSGTVGALVGGAVTGSRVGLYKTREAIFNRAFHAHLGKDIDASIENAVKNNISPDKAAAQINRISPDTIQIDAEAVQGYMQKSKNPQKLAERLGVTEEELKDAVSNGQDISVQKGDYVAACMEDMGFKEAVKDDVSYSQYDSSTNYYILHKAMQEAYKADDVAMNELDTELDTVVKSALDTGYVSEGTARGLRALMAARALIYSPENPAQFFKDHPVRFERGVQTDVQNGYNQAAYIYEYNDTTDFKSKLDSKKPEERSGESYKYYSKNGGIYELMGSIFNHVTNNEHPLTEAEWDDVLKYIDDFSSIEKAQISSDTGSNGEARVLQKIITPNGVFGVVVEYTRKGRIKIITGGKDGRDNINVDHWFTLDKRPQALDLASLQNVGHLGPTSYINSVKQKLGIVKNFYVRGGNKLKQESNLIDKGNINWNENGQTIIQLFKGADASTVIHETGHFFVETLIQDAQLEGAPEQLVKDMQALLAYSGMTLEQWNNADVEGRREAHEHLAEAFESYLITGKAPSVELRSVFRRFSDWLCKVYKLAKGEILNENRNENAIELTPEVTEVFDRMLASREQIAVVEQVEGYFNSLPTEMLEKLPPAIQDKLKAYIQKARDMAVEILTKEALQNYTKERRAKIAREREELTTVFSEGEAQSDFWIANREIKDAFGHKAKAVANRYLNLGLQNYLNWKAKLDEAQKAVDDLFAGTLGEMETTSKQGVEWGWFDKDGNYLGDEASFDNSDKAVKNAVKAPKSNNAQWYRDFYYDHGRAPSEKEKRQIAYDNLTNPEPKYVLNSTAMSQGHPDYAAEIAKQKKQIDDAIAKRDYLKRKQESMRREQYKSLSEDERVLFDAIAESIGMTGPELAEKIRSTPSFNEYIKQMVDTAIKETYGDLVSDKAAFEEKAREAFYNDDTGRLLALQDQLVREYASKLVAEQGIKNANKVMARIRREMAKNGAVAVMDKLSVRDIQNTRLFIRAERKAAALYNKALKTGDTMEASRQKRIQMLNHELVRESLRRKQQIKKAQKYLVRLHNLKMEKWHNQNLFMQTALLFERINMRHKDVYDSRRPKDGDNKKRFDIANATMNLAQYVEDFNIKNPDNKVLDIAPWLYDGTDVDLRFIDSLNYQQFNDVVDAFKNLRKVADMTAILYTVADKMDQAQYKTKAAEELSKLASKFIPKLGEKQQATFKERFDAYMMNADNFFEMMDNWSYGFFTNTMYKAIKHSQDFEAMLTENFENIRTEAYRKWLPTAEAIKAANQKIYYEELGTDCDKHTLIQMLCNLGNAENTRRICQTAPSKALENSTIWVKPSEDVSVEDAIEMTRNNLIAFLSKVLTKEDVQYAQALIDSANGLWSELEGVNIRTKGFAPKKVEATPFAMIINDEMVMFKGGYFPLVSNNENGATRAGVVPGMSGDPEQGNFRPFLHTNQGSSQQRTSAAYPVDITRGAELYAINKTINDIAWRETYIDFRNLLQDKEFYSLMKEKLGIAHMDALTEMLEKCCNPSNYTKLDGGERGLAFAASWLRAKTVNAAIMLNFKVALQNFGNVFLYGNAIDGFDYKDVIRGMGRMGMAADPSANSELRQMVLGKSIFMRERSQFPDISIREVAGNEKLNPLEKQTLRFGSMLLAYTDNLTALPMWAEAYSKKINAGADEQAAIDFADALIRRTIGSNRAADVASYQRGGPIYKLFTTFQGFFVTQFNQWRREAAVDFNLIQAGRKDEAIQRIIAFVASKWLLACMANLIFAMENPFEEDKNGHMAITKEVLHYPISTTGWPGAIGNAAIDQLVGFEGYGYRMTAIQGNIDTILKTAGRINKAAIKDKPDYQGLVEAMTSFGGSVAGVPSQFNKLFWNAYDIVVGEMDLEARDLVSRRPKKERKVSE